MIGEFLERGAHTPGWGPVIDKLEKAAHRLLDSKLKATAGRFWLLLMGMFFILLLGIAAIGAVIYAVYAGQSIWYAWALVGISTGACTTGIYQTLRLYFRDKEDAPKDDAQKGGK